MYFFLITLVVVALCSCWVLAWSLEAFFLNHIDRCGLVFLLAAGLVVGSISFLFTLVVVSFCCRWMLAWSLDGFSLNYVGRCGLVFLLDAGLI